jgi:two-component system, NarL family, response regulator DesR
MARILLAEDQAMVRGALATLLELEDDLEVVAQVARGNEVLHAALRTRPDVALLDIEMPGGDGLQALATLTQQLPECRVIILTTFGRPGYLRQAINAGAAAYLLKDSPAAELARTIRRVLAGQRVIDPALAAQAFDQGINPLTAREQDVLRAAADGAPIANIAARLYLSRGTVRNHLSAAIRKLGVSNRGEAVCKAQHQGWL